MWVHDWLRKHPWSLVWSLIVALCGLTVTVLWTKIVETRFGGPALVAFDAAVSFSRRQFSQPVPLWTHCIQALIWILFVAVLVVILRRIWRRPAGCIAADEAPPTETSSPAMIGSAPPTENLSKIRKRHFTRLRPNVYLYGSDGRRTAIPEFIWDWKGDDITNPRVLCPNWK